MPFLVEGILLAFLTIRLRRTFNDILLGGTSLFDLLDKFVETENLGLKDVHGIDGRVRKHNREL